MDMLAHAVGRGIDMGRPRGCARIFRRRQLHRETFEHILWLLQEALDTWIAFNPIM
jgi:hypothetical protein